MINLVFVALRRDSLRNWHRGTSQLGSGWDSSNYCLTMTKKNGLSWDWLQYNFVEVSKITVAPCDGSLNQKWNAPVSISEGMGLKDYNEK